jgi:AAA ATPase domain
MAVGGLIIPLAGTADDNPWMGVRFSGPLVGRDAELRRLDAALARASRGSSAVVLVGGEAGVGKSRLAAEAADRAGASASRRPCWSPPTGAMSCTAATGSVRSSPTSTATPPSSDSSCGASAATSSPSCSPPASAGNPTPTWWSA